MSQVSTATFEVYLREYLCKNEEEIKREKVRFNHCAELVKKNKVYYRSDDEIQTEEPEED